jgi:hypothetical protein
VEPRGDAPHLDGELFEVGRVAALSKPIEHCVDDFGDRCLQPSWASDIATCALAKYRPTESRRRSSGAAS